MTRSTCPLVRYAVGWSPCGTAAHGEPAAGVFCAWADIDKANRTAVGEHIFLERPSTINLRILFPAVSATSALVLHCTHGNPEPRPDRIPRWPRRKVF